MASTGVRRVARGSAAAAVSTFVALLSHLVGGGAPPALLGVTAPLVLSIAVCTLLAGRRLALPRLAASVVGSQALFHVLFVLGTPTGVTAADGAGVSAEHVHEVVLTSAATHGHPLDAGMWWAHAIAAIVTIAALRRGERACAQLVAVGRVVLARFARGRQVRADSIRPVVLRRSTAAAEPWTVLTGMSSDGTETRSRRGPPLVPIAV